MKKHEDFTAVINYLTKYGFRSIKEMEDYLKKNGFTVHFLNFWTDDEKNPWMLKVDIRHNQVYSMETIITTPIEIMKKADGLAFF